MHYNMKVYTEVEVRLHVLFNFSVRCAWVARFIFQLLSFWESLSNAAWPEAAVGLGVVV
jgi:hypothetical protein